MPAEKYKTLKEYLKHLFKTKVSEFGGDGSMTKEQALAVAYKALKEGKISK